MFVYKELEKWLNKRGKYNLTWERDKEYNYVMDGAVLVKFPRNDVLTNEENELYTSFDTDDKEKLLKCEKVLFYHFMKPPIDNQALKKVNDNIQVCLMKISDLFLSDNINDISRTGLYQTKGSSLLSIYYDGEYRYYNQVHISLVDEMFEDKFVINNSGHLYNTDNHTAIIITQVKLKDDNKYLKSRFGVVK